MPEVTGFNLFSPGNLWMVFLGAAILFGVMNRELYLAYSKRHRPTRVHRLSPSRLTTRLLRFVWPPIKADVRDSFKTLIILQYMAIGFFFVVTFMPRLLLF